MAIRFLDEPKAVEKPIVGKSIRFLEDEPPAFNASNSIPVKEGSKGIEVSPPFDITTAKPAVEDVEQKPPEGDTKFFKEAAERQEKILEKTGELALKGVLGALKVIRWPFWRFIEQPVSTLVTAAQDPRDRKPGEVLGKAFQGYVPFKKIPVEEYGDYGQIWRNYYKAIMNTEPPDWYVAMASYGTAVGIEPPLIRAGVKGAEYAATRAATQAEIALLRQYPNFKLMDRVLKNGGVDITKLHTEGNIIKVTKDTEIWFNKYQTAIFKGTGEVRIPRWAKIKKPSVVVDKKINDMINGVVPISPKILPVTGPQIVVPPTKIPVEPTQKGKIVIDKKTGKPLVIEGEAETVTGFHIVRSEAGVQKIEKEGFSLKLFGTESGTKEGGDPVGVYFFPDKNFPEEWAEIATKENVLERELSLKNPYVAESAEKYFKEVVVPATNTEAKSLSEFRGMAKEGDSEKVTEFLKSKGHDGILDKEGVLSFEEPQIIVFDPSQIKIKSAIPSEEPTLVTQEQVQAKVIEGIKAQAKGFRTEKEFVEAISRGELELPVEDFGEFGVTTFQVDKELAREMFREANIEKITATGELKRQIYANAAVRGISKVELDKAVKKQTSKGSITNKSLTEDELVKVLQSLKKVRPKRIGGREVITKRTENAIKTTRDNMIKNSELTLELYQKILNDMGIRKPEYAGAFQFITESKGKQLLFNMRNLGNIYKDTIKIEEAYKANKPVGEFNKLIDEVNPRQALPKINTLMDAHHAYDSLQLQTKLPFGTAFEKTRKHWREAQQDIDKINMGVLEKGGDKWAEIVASEESLTRMDAYLGFKRPQYVRGKPEFPKNITPEEKAMVDAMIKYGESVAADIRYDRTLQWIKDGTRIPNAPIRELNKAEQIYLEEGQDALREWVKGRDWGTITGGAYDFGAAMKGKIRLYKPKAGVSKKGLASKETLQYTQYDTNLVNRFKSYVRGITLRKYLRDDVNTLQSLAETAQGQFEDPSLYLDAINRNLLEILGQKTGNPQALDTFFRNLYAQAARTLFLDARKGVRNLFQNAALFTTIEDVFVAVPLSAEDAKFFDTYVKQESSIKYDFLYADAAGIPFLKNVNELADLINVMGRTDTINRYVAFRMKLGGVREGLKNNPDYMKSVDTLNKMIKDSGLGELTVMERKHALDVLIIDGEDAFARYAAKAVVEKVHFLYTRFERGFAEQGNELSKVLSNLLVFRKGYVQRIALDISKLRPSQEKIEAPIAGRRKAARSLFTATVVATIVGGLYKKVTGDKRNPYRPDSLVGGFSLGGLATGSQDKLNEFSRTAMLAATGDKAALGKLPNVITSSADFFLPFYDDVLNLIETSTDMKNIDTKALRKIREALDETYEVRNTDYMQERSKIEKAQHAFFGTDRDKEPSKRPKIGR